MSESIEKTKRLAMVLKFLGATLAALAGPVGAWYTATAQSRADLEAGYKALAETVSDLEKAVDMLQGNEQRRWRRESEKEAKQPEASEAPAPSRVRAARASRSGSGGFGAISGSAGAEAAPPAAKPADIEVKLPPPPSYEVRKAPSDLDEALKQAAR